jgi:hypothetical protein
MREKNQGNDIQYKLRWEKKQCVSALYSKGVVVVVIVVEVVVVVVVAVVVVVEEWNSNIQ